MKLDTDISGRLTFNSLVCMNCGWVADAFKRSRAEWQALKHAEREGCQDFEMEMVETRVVSVEVQDAD